MGCFSSLIHAKLQKQALLCAISGLEAAPDAATISCAPTARAQSNLHPQQRAPISPKFPRNQLVAAARRAPALLLRIRGLEKQCKEGFGVFFLGCAGPHHRRVCVQCKTAGNLFYKGHKPRGAGWCSEVIKSPVPASGILCQGVSVPAPHPAPLMVISKLAPCFPT